MTTVRIQANVPWQIVQGRGGAWVGICEPLQLTVQSQTWTELMEDIGRSLDAILKDLLASNELPDFLRERGWQLMSPLPSRSEEDVRFDVPFFPAMMANGSQREFRQ